MSTPELKPLLNCPFCGEQPVIDRRDGHLVIECGNEDCRAVVQVIDADRAEAIWNTRHNPAESALNAAREAIENAPHEMRCNCVLDSNGFVVRCDCWKAEALAQIDKALSPQQSKTT